jgi:hypothetical protein
VLTVQAQGLSGCEVARWIDICRDEERCLVTLDAEFGSPLIFKPRDYRGIVLIRAPWPSRRRFLSGPASTSSGLA